MIGTITMNPCMDKTLTISDFTYGGMNRVTEKKGGPLRKRCKYFHCFDTDWGTGAHFRIGVCQWE